MDYRIFVNFIWILLLFNGGCFVSCYRVDLEDDGPIVKGATITFTARVYDIFGKRMESGTFKYEWTDNAIPAHSAEYETTNGTDVWTVKYNETVYPPGPYIVQVKVCRSFIGFVCVWPESNRVIFYINETLNGHIDLVQKKGIRQNIYVSNAEPVIHNVSLKKTDDDFVKGAPTVLTYWFIDCTYYGFRTDFSFPFNYTQPDKDHLVEALIVADFTPLPPPTTTTTTTTTTTPKSTTKTTSITTTTTSKPTTKKTPAENVTTPVTPAKNIIKRSVDNKNVTSKIMVKVNGTLVPYEGTFPYICNSTAVVTDSAKIYGYFAQNLIVKAPVSKVNVTGNNWLRHGELLTLNVKCQGSKNLKYCVYFVEGVHNVTGNETCYRPHELEFCEFTVQRYFSDAIEHTIILIIENEVSKIVTPVAVKIYEVKTQAQLSVIVVPVAFCLVAVVLIVFGVAYYLQNRSRFVVEVADFNFGQNYSDMEYKTFRERLRDSIYNAFFSRGPSPGSSEVPVWPPGRKYGSMTS